MEKPAHTKELDTLIFDSSQLKIISITKSLS